MAEAQTTGDLYKAKAILDDDVNAAVAAYFTDQSASSFPIAKGYKIDIAAAVEASEFAKNVTTSAETTDHLKRAAVRTAILLARPVKA